MSKRLFVGAVLFLAVVLLRQADAAFVSDRLFLGIYPLPDSTSTPLKMLASGTEVEILEEQGDYVRIKAKDGSEGWARAEFIGDKTPASLTIKQVTAQRDQLQAQLNAIGVTEKTVTHLQRQLAKANQTIKDLRKDAQGKQEAAEERVEQQQASQQALSTEMQEKLAQAEAEIASLKDESQILKTKLRAATGDSTEDVLEKVGWLLASMLLSLIIGSLLGANWLARRVRSRFNGRKVW